MRTTRAFGTACAGSAIVVTVLMGTAGVAESGPDPAPRVAGPGAMADLTGVPATPPPRGTAPPTDTKPTPPEPTAPVAAPCEDCAGGSPSATVEGVDVAPGGQPSTSPATGPDRVVTSGAFSGLPTGTRWVDGSVHGGWTSVYDGYGTTSVEAGEPAVLSQRPNAATSPGVTHGALAVTVGEYGDVDFTVRQRTVSQLRSPRPNAWEVPWALWAHADDQHFYYLVLKPNGWELGKEDPAYPGAQRFLATGSSPTFAVGAWHTVRIRQVGNTIEAWGDGQLLTRFVDHERPYASGHIGLYTEDAHVQHTDLVVRQP